MRGNKSQIFSKTNGRAHFIVTTILDTKQETSFKPKEMSPDDQRCLKTVQIACPVYPTYLDAGLVGMSSLEWEGGGQALMAG